jgi:capsule polysaccharide export protein KpsE/RkpR
MNDKIRAVESAPWLDDTDEGITLRRVSIILLANRKMLLRLPLAVGLATLAIVLLIPRKYTTTVSFTPVARSGPSSQLGAIAAQFGVSLGLSGAQTPAFYGDLVQTPDLLRPLLETQYEIRDGSEVKRGTILDLYGMTDSDQGKALDNALQFFNKEVLSVDVDNGTSVITASFRTKWRDLSFQSAKRLLDLLDQFNLESYQAQAGQQWRFLSQQVDTAAAALGRAQGDLERFLQRNRSFLSDPSLQFAHDRLQQEVTLREGVYSMLVQGREQARVESARNTPSISIIRKPMPALTFDRRFAIVKTIGAAFVAFVLVFMVGALRLALAKDSVRDELLLATLIADSKAEAQRWPIIGRYFAKA